MFSKESDFEQALISYLYEKCGWEKEVLKYKTEKDLLRNWADILYENNNTIDRLNSCPLTDTEMQQIIEKIKMLNTPIALNKFVNGNDVIIKRDNPADLAHFGREIPLKIYDRNEIAAGQSRYQIAQQTRYTVDNKIFGSSRGDLLLLINGMPLIHIELKRSGIPVSEAYNQIKKYSKHGVFNGLFSLVQIFVAMNPEESLYFANPGEYTKFNPEFAFHWADFNNEPVNKWSEFARQVLSIPTAHELIGFYTVPDESDGILKILRSYQIYAVRAISARVKQVKWSDKEIFGGYIWHTTGSGKTMTSFKAAQLIADSKDADKVIFLVDRIDLGTQSLSQYRHFAGKDGMDVQGTENTDVLLAKMKSSNPADRLIVTSIQKMSNINEESAYNQKDIDTINSKRIVFIVDECHRSVFGKMLSIIKETFPRAIYFGFSGTPIHDENQKKMSTTADIFGSELHRYSIADGIRDNNVLGFDPVPVATFKDIKLREAVALNQSESTSVAEALKDPKKKAVYEKFMDKSQYKMAAFVDKNGAFHKGIEDYVPSAQYCELEHKNAVVDDIIENFDRLSRQKKFHAIFATSSINEAIDYYRLFKNKKHNLKVVALFDQSIDNNDSFDFKEDGVIEILQDYNKQYNQDFTLSSFQKYKKDIVFRLAHKQWYRGIENNPKEQIDLLIVVDQLLTGYDSKWINTLYLDKMLRFENIIQAFSRTNRIFQKNEKPFGNIRYYRRPHTMQKLVEVAFKLYSGDKTLGVFVDKLEKNLAVINDTYLSIKTLFESFGIANFEQLPEEREAIARFARLFRDLKKYYDAATVQGFQWTKSVYEFYNQKQRVVIVSFLTKDVYNILLQRYKEIPTLPPLPGQEIPFEIDSYIVELQNEQIDANYMQSKFTKYLKSLEIGTKEDVEKALVELHKTFAMLSQEDQKFATVFLHDIQSGNVIIQEGKSLKDYICEYKAKAKDDQIHKFAKAIGLNEDKLRYLMSCNLSEKDLNEFGRFDDLMSTLDIAKAKLYLEKKEGKLVLPFKVLIQASNEVRSFILSEGFDVYNV